MSVYNAKPYLADAIRSILAQTFADFELIIADGGSMDTSPETIRTFAAQDARIRPLFLEYCTISHALNVSAKMARGQYVAYMTADDLALPQRFVEQLAWLRQSRTDVGGTCTHCFGDTGGFIWFPEAHDALCRELLFRCPFLLPTVMLRADILKEHSFDEQALFQEYELWTRLAPHYRLGNLQRVLVHYRRHPQQDSARNITKLVAEHLAIAQRYFNRLYPNASSAERERHRRIIHQEPFLTIEDLESAGLWLIELSDSPENLLRQGMALRWQRACRASSTLGDAADQLYQKLLPQFRLEHDG